MVFDYKQLDELIEIYVENDVFRKILNLEYYFFSKEQRENNKRIFINLYCELKKIKINKYSKYTTLYCAEKYNRIEKYENSRRRIFQISDLIDKDSYKLLKRYKINRELCLLIGLNCSNFIEYNDEVINWFTTCLENEDNDAIKSYICHKLALIYNRFEKNFNESLIMELKSYDLQKNFLNMHGLAEKYREKEDYEKSLEFYKLIIEDFKQIPIECLEPKELLSYYKAYSIASYTCCVLIKQYYAAIYYANKALQIYDSVENVKFFEELYGEDSKNYKEILKSNMSIDKIYLYLAVSNREIGNHEEKEKWVEKVRV